MVNRFVLFFFCLLMNSFAFAATPAAANATTTPSTQPASVAPVPQTEKAAPAPKAPAAAAEAEAANDSSDEESDDESEDEDATPAAAPVKAHPTRIFLYWDGRLDIPPPALKIHGLIVGSAQLQHAKDGKFTSDFTASGNFQKAGNRHHLLWSRWATKYSIIGANAYLGYGGELNELLRDYLLKANDQSLSEIANEMTGNLRRYHFTGLDINVQYWWDYNKSQNETFAKNFAKLVKLIRHNLNQDPQSKDYPITIAVGWNAAGWVSGVDDFQSPYSGSMLPFFKDPEAVAAISAVNILTFGTNATNLYTDLQKIENMLNTFVIAGVPKEKLILGVQPYQTADAEALEPYSVYLLARFIKQHGFGGVALFGITPDIAVEVRADEYIEAMRNGLDVIDVLPPPPKPK